MHDCMIAMGYGKKEKRSLSWEVIEKKGTGQRRTTYGYTIDQRMEPVFFSKLIKRGLLLNTRMEFHESFPRILFISSTLPYLTQVNHSLSRDIHLFYSTTIQTVHILLPGKK